MNTVTPEQLAEAEKAEREAWQAFYDYDLARRDAEYTRLNELWLEASKHRQKLRDLFNAQILIASQS